MQTETSPRGSSRRRRSSRLAAFAAAAAGVGVLLTGCGGSDDDGTGGAGDGTADASSSSSSPSSSPSSERETGQRVLWVGDSIAAVQAPALEAALTASGVAFEDASSVGGGTVVEGDEMSGPLADATWDQVEERIASFRPGVIAYQITTYDWGTPEQQRASYEKLAGTARDAGAELVIVSAPPYRIDDFYRPHEDALAGAPEVAAEVAEAGGDGVHFLDAGELWGTDSDAEQAQRSADGIHSCQQGSAAFAAWFGEELGERYGFTPAAPEEWATGSWTSDEQFGHLGCE